MANPQVQVGQTQTITLNPRSMGQKEWEEAVASWYYAVHPNNPKPSQSDTAAYADMTATYLLSNPANNGPFKQFVESWKQRTDIKLVALEFPSKPSQDRPADLRITASIGDGSSAVTYLIFERDPPTIGLDDSGKPNLKLLPGPAGAGSASAPAVSSPQGPQLQTATVTSVTPAQVASLEAAAPVGLAQAAANVAAALEKLKAVAGKAGQGGGRPGETVIKLG